MYTISVVPTQIFGGLADTLKLKITHDDSTRLQVYYELINEKAPGISHYGEMALAGKEYKAWDRTFEGLAVLVKKHLKISEEGTRKKLTGK